MSANAAGYWRTAVGEEVDFVIEAGGQLLPIEVKAASRPRLAEAAQQDTLWYYETLAAAFAANLPGQLADELKEIVEALKASRNAGKSRAAHSVPSLWTQVLSCDSSLSTMVSSHNEPEGHSL